jgi:cell division septal protein FtsQ
MSGSRRAAACRRGGGHARRPGPPLRKRLAVPLPSRGRAFAVLGFALAVAGFVTLVNGPWLRIGSVAHAGARYTPAWELDGIVDSYRGQSLLTLDTDALLRRVRQLPAVADASVQTSLPGELRVTVREKKPAVIWRTASAQLVAAADGSIIDDRSLSETLTGELAGLPVVDDTRPRTQTPRPGDVLPQVDVRTAMRLLRLNPKVIGSRARHLEVSVDRTYGFEIASSSPPWRAALGFYELDPEEDRTTADVRLEQQLGAIRTLFATRREWAVSWLDARNPGKVYWSP